MALLSLVARVLLLLPLGLVHFIAKYLSGPLYKLMAMAFELIMSYAWGSMIASSS